MLPSPDRSSFTGMSRRRSRSTTSPIKAPPSPPLPTQTYHHASILVPTPALVESVAGAAHYSGIKVDTATTKRRHSSHESHAIHSDAVETSHRRVLSDLSELYNCRPTPELFNRAWNTDATVEHPLSHCEGFNEYAPHWYALPKICSKSETIASRILSSTSVPNRVIYSQTQLYTIRWFGSTKVCISHSRLARSSRSHLR